MAITGQQILTIGTENQPTGSETLYSAFNKVQNNFTNLFSTSSPFNTFASGNGIHASSNPTSGTVTITNTGVLNLFEGSGVTLSGSNGNVTISATGTGGSTGVTRVGLISPRSTLLVTGGPIVGAGNIAVDLPNIPVSGDFVSGAYTAPTLFVDPQGRITKIANTTGVGTVSSIAIENGGGLEITGSPITRSGTINIKNKGVTSITNGGGLTISSTTGDITIAATNQSTGTVTSVEVTSTSLNVTGGPITSSGPITVELKDPTVIGNIRVIGTANIGIANVSTLLVNGNANVAGNLNVSSDAIITGNLTVNGTTTTVNSTVVTVNDKNIVLANNQTTSDGANGSGITIGSSIATWNYSNVSNGWVASNTITATGNVYINSTSNSTGSILNSASGGALQVAGGVSIQKDLNVAGLVTTANILANKLTIANISISQIIDFGSSSTINTKSYGQQLSMTGGTSAELTQAAGKATVTADLTNGVYIKVVDSSSVSRYWYFDKNGNFKGPVDAFGNQLSGNITIGNTTISKLTVGNSTANSTFGNGTINSTTINATDFVSSNSFTVSNTSGIMFNTQTNNAKFTALQPPDTILSGQGLYAANGQPGGNDFMFWNLPNTWGKTQQFLTTNGAGTMQWNTIASSSAPATATSTGVAGQIAYDSTHIYVCIATNSWIRTNAATW